MIAPSLSFFRRTALAAFACALAFALPSATGAEEEKPHNLSEKTSEALQKLKPLIDANNYDSALALLDGIPNIDPQSYDAAFIFDIKAKLYIHKDQLGKAVEPWEAALRLSDTYHYFSESQTNEMVLLLSQIIYTEAVAVKDHAAQQQLVEKAASYLKRYLEHTKKPTPENRMFYAQLLYSQATADPNHIDPARMKEVRTQIEAGLLTTLHPKESFYQLLLAILQQENDYVRSSEILELLVKQYPAKTNYWPVLMATYLNLAANEKEESPRRREYYVRAINTLERAQAVGLMKTPKDNYNLFTIYLNAGQLGKADDLLYHGMKTGAIESNITNWRTLGYYYQQDHKELDAVAALKEAAQIFPKDGSFEVQIADLYQQQDKVKDARDHYIAALKKGGLEKPHLAYYALAYCDYELKDFEAGLQAVNESLKESAKLPDNQKNQQIPNLKTAIEGAIAERDAAKAARDAEAKRL